MQPHALLCSPTPATRPPRPPIPPPPPPPTHTHITHLPDHVHKQLGVVGGKQRRIGPGFWEPRKGRLVLIVAACSGGGRRADRDASERSTMHRHAAEPATPTPYGHRRMAAQAGRLVGDLQRGLQQRQHKTRVYPRKFRGGQASSRPPWRAPQHPASAARHAPVPPAVRSTARTSARKASSRGYIEQANIASCHTSTPASSHAS